MKEYKTNEELINRLISKNVIVNHLALKVQGLCLLLKAVISTKSPYLVILNDFSISSV